MIIKIIFPIIILACMSSVVYADMSGNDLLKMCEAQIDSADGVIYDNKIHQAYYAGNCIGYLEGISAMHFFMAVKQANSTDMVKIQKFYSYCIPKKISGRELVGIVVKYLKNHPEELHQDASILFMKAHEYYFPCKQ